MSSIQKRSYGSRVGPSPNKTGVLTKGKFAPRRRLGECNVKMKTEFGVECPHAEEHQTQPGKPQKLGENVKRFSLTSLMRKQPFGECFLFLHKPSNLYGK